MGMEIRTEELVKSYRGRRVVDGISVSVHEGEIVGLLGHNGAGKTTTFYMVVGLVKPDRGRVLLNGQNVTRQPIYRRAGARSRGLPAGRIPLAEPDRGRNPPPALPDALDP